MLLFLKCDTQQINMPAVYNSRKLNLNSETEADGNKSHICASDKHLKVVQAKS